MTARSKNITTSIFLIALFVLLAVVIAGWLHSIYVSNVTYTTVESKSVIECQGYVFEVDKESLVYDYETGILQFEIENKYGDQFNTIVVETKDSKQEVVTGAISKYTKCAVELNITLNEFVKIYPKGCGQYNFERFAIN